MADANTEVTLTAMQDAIAKAVKAAFPAFQTVEFDRDDEDEQLPCPACLMEFTEAQSAPEEDAGTGQWPAHARFEARIVLAARKTARAEVKRAAVSFAAWLNQRRFPGIYTDPCQVIACEPDEFAPDLERFRVWRVEWIMPAMFGHNVWLPDGTTTPGEPYYSQAPDIGVPHEQDYQPLLSVEVAP